MAPIPTKATPKASNVSSPNNEEAAFARKWRHFKLHFHRNYWLYLVGATVSVWGASNYWVRGGSSEPVVTKQSLLSWKKECEKQGKKKIEELGLDLKSELEKNIPIRDVVVSLYPLNQQNNIKSYSMTKEEQVKFLDELFPDLVTRYKQQHGVK